MDTMLILHATLLLVVAVVPSYSENKTSPVRSTITSTKLIAITTSKIMDHKNTTEDDSPTAKSKRGVGGFSKNQDPSFSSSLTTFDESPSIVNTDSVLGFSGGKSLSKDIFDIDDIEVQPSPSFNIGGSSFKGSSTFRIENPNVKDTSSFDIDAPSYGLEGASFNFDGDTFNLDSPTFAAEGVEVKDHPSFIHATNFELDKPLVKGLPPSFESNFHNAKRSPSYNPESIIGSIPESSRSRKRPYRTESYESQRYKPEASNIRSTSASSPIIDSASRKNYEYPKSHLPSHTNLQNLHPKVYSSVSPKFAYGDNRVKYVGSLTTPISQIYNSYSITPHYKNYVTTISSGADRSTPTSNVNYAFPNPSGASNFQKIQDANSYKNSFFIDQGAFGEYPAFQNLNSFPQNGFVKNSDPQVTQTPIYQSQYPGPKNSQQFYLPTHQTAISFTPSTQSFGKLSSHELKNEATPSSPVQIRNDQGFPGFIQSLEAEPVLLPRRNDFKTIPNFGHSFDYEKRSENQPFLSTTDSYQPQQVIPVQTSSSTPQFPMYKGASIEAYSTGDFEKQPGSYQLLANQPQLHFNTNSLSERPQYFSTPKSSERIKEDVEIIKKGKAPQDDDNEDEEEVNDDDSIDLDEGYKSIEREYDQSYENERSEPQSESRENDSSERYSGELDLEFKSMPPMPTFVFKPYDEKVGRLHEFVNQPEPQNRFSENGSAEEDEEDSPKIYSSTYSPVAENDQQSPRSYFGFPFETAYDEDTDEEETRRYTKQEDKVDFPSKYKENIDDPYKNQPLQNKYSYDLKSPAEYGTNSQKISKFSRGRNLSPKPSYRNLYDVDEGNVRNTRTGSRKPMERVQKNTEEQETITASRTEPQIIHEESFGYKIPKEEERKKKPYIFNKTPTVSLYSRSAKDNGAEMFSNVKKTPTEDSFIQTKRGSYNFNSPKKGKTDSNENGDSFSISSTKNWKTSRKSPEVSEFVSHPAQQAKNVAYITEDDYNYFSPERIRPGLSGSIFRDFIDTY